MNKKLFALIFFGMIFISLSANNVESYFTKSHLEWSINGITNIDSPLANKCKPYLANVLDGNTATDTLVLFYTSSEKVRSYISSHTRGSGYQACLDLGGSDVEMQCFCVGNALHLIQDRWSHLEGGITAKYLENNFAPNIIGHMSVEKDFENKHMSKLQKNADPTYTAGQLDYYNSRVLNTMFTETGGSDKYFKLLSAMSGLPQDEIINVVKTFRSGYLGEGFYSTVYKDKVKLPYFLIIIPSILIFLGLIIPIILIKFGKTRWKWITTGLWTIFLIIGIIILISFLTGTTWRITTLLIQVPQTIGYLSISQADIDFYDKMVQRVL